jgi:hypothetical protein
METGHSYETLVNLDQTQRRYIQEDGTSRSHSRENFQVNKT